MTAVLISNQSAWEHEAVQRAMAAWQRQVAGDFAPSWGASAVLHFIGPRKLADDEWGLTIDDRSSAEYLGEHHLEGVPRGVVLLGACKAAGDSPEETGSHEVLELLGDPWANICIELEDGTMEAYEACDAVQGSSYEIDGVQVANFVKPLGYFNGKGGGYDFRNALSSEHAMTPGGYRLLKTGQGWGQVTGSRVLGASRAPTPWSRRGRRMARGK